MGVPHIRGFASHTDDVVQAQRVPFQSPENAAEGDLGYDPELSIPGGVCRFIPR